MCHIKGHNEKHKKGHNMILMQGMFNDLYPMMSTFHNISRFVSSSFIHNAEKSPIGASHWDLYQSLPSKTW